MFMKNLFAALSLVAMASTAFAQTTTDGHGVTTSTDPAKAAAVEHQGATLKAEAQKGTTDTATSTHKAKAHHARHHRRVKVAATK
jgi:hypothetical protein